MRAACALERPADPKHPEAGSVRAALEALERAGAGRDPQLDSVRVPRGFEYLWDLFWQIHRGASVGMAGAALSWVDLEAYQRVTGTVLDAFEVETVMAMDCAARG